MPERRGPARHEGGAAGNEKAVGQRPQPDSTNFIRRLAGPPEPFRSHVRISRGWTWAQIDHETALVIPRGGGMTSYHPPERELRRGETVRCGGRPPSHGVEISLF